MAYAESSSIHSPVDVVRQPSGVFSPTVWGDYFITHTPMASSKLEKIKKRIDELKEVIKKQLRDTSDQLQSLEMIDAIQHLGVAYHFELEINDALKKIYRHGFEESKDLHTIALGFRLLRQQRFIISADIFNKFMKKGDFEESLKCDGKGLLSLYEAAHLGTQKEKILENALKFARTHLKLMLGNMDQNFATIASRSLERPRFRRSERLEAREYISIFEEEKNRSELLLLEFAKLDFHLVQSIHLEELLHLTLWKNSMALFENLPFARDRLVELHFWMTGTYFEPSYSRARIMSTKLIVLTSILDDIYDQYGTLEDLELLTMKIERWELLRVDQLPMYLQYFCTSLYKTFKDFDEQLSFEQNSFRVRFLEKEMKKLARAFFVEARWGNEHYIPNIQEHLHISLCSCAYPLVFCALFLGMHEVIPSNVYEWVTEFPEIVKASCIICRVMNDITSDEHEERDNHFATIVDSYTKEKKCTKEEACDKLRAMVEDAWKTLNQEYLLSNLPLFIVQPIIKLSRMLELFYKDKDNYTNPFGFIKDKIKLLMVDPILSNWE